MGQKDISVMLKCLSPSRIVCVTLPSKSSTGRFYQHGGNWALNSSLFTLVTK